MSVQIVSIQNHHGTAFRALWDQYNQFYKRTISDHITKTTFTRLTDESVRMYGAVAIDTAEDDKVIGFVTWYPHPSTASIEEVVYLHDLFVDPGTRNGGTGRKLIEHVYDHAKSLNASSVYWHTQFFNHRAQLLYVKVADRTDFVKYQKTL